MFKKSGVGIDHIAVANQSLLYDTNWLRASVVIDSFRDSFDYCSQYEGCDIVRKCAPLVNRER